MALSRRQLLIGAAGVLGVGVVGRAALTGGDGMSGTTRTGTFTSHARGDVATSWTINYPAHRGTTKLRPLIVLHGRSGNNTSAFAGGLHFDQVLDGIVNDGAAPFAIASVDGGDHSYWHPRKDGDAAAMVIDEFLPLLAQEGLDTSRIGLLGWSMGGYGALYLSSVLRSPRVAVAVAESPAIWHHADQAVAGAFDDAADFNAHQLWGRQGVLDQIPLRIDCGASDGFAPVTRDLRASLHPTPAGGIEPGGHNVAYWKSQAKAQLTFVSQHLPHA